MLVAATVTILHMLYSDQYWPPDCGRKTCVLTGRGGIVAVWDDHVRQNRRKTFVVKGLCASACERAARRAAAQGSKVVIKRGAVLIYHKPEKATWR